jgi:hypothetical protein
MLYAEDVDGPGQAPTVGSLLPTAGAAFPPGSVVSGASPPYCVWLPAERQLTVPPTHPEEGPGGGQGCARSAPLFIHSSLHEHPNITPIYFPILLHGVY